MAKSQNLSTLQKVPHSEDSLSRRLNRMALLTKMPRRKEHGMDQYSLGSIVSMTWKRVMLMKLVKAKLKAVIIDNESNLALSEKLYPPRVVAQQIMIKRRHIMEESNGEMTHEEMILTTCSHAMLEAPQPTRPAPTRAEMTVWVPLIGIPKILDAMMKQKDAIETASIIRVWYTAV